MDKNAVEVIQNKKLWFFQLTLLSSKAEQPVETHTRPEKSELIPQGGKIQNGDTRTIRGVGYLNRFQGRLLPHANNLRFYIQDRSYQFTALPFGLTTTPMEFTVKGKEVKLMTIHKGIRIHQYLHDWLVRVRSHQACLQHTQELVEICQKLGWMVNLEKSELDPKQVF